MKRILYILVVVLSLISSLYGQTSSKDAYLEKAFSPLAKKCSQYVAALMVNEGQEGYATLIEGNLAFTKSSLVPKDSSIRLQQGGNSYRAKVLGRDHQNDIALLKILSSKPVAGFLLAQKPRLEVGTWSISVGSEGFLQAGVISALDRKVRVKKRGGGLFTIFGFLGLSGGGPLRNYEKVIQHDGPVQKSSFGSALINSKGELVGINVSFAYRGTGYAVDISHLTKTLSTLKQEKAYLGAYVSERKQGLLVDTMIPGGPAQKAGFKRKDLLLKMDGKKLLNLQDLTGRISQKKPGEKVTFTLLREGKTIQVEVILGKRN